MPRKPALMTAISVAEQQDAMDAKRDEMRPAQGSPFLAAPGASAFREGSSGDSRPGREEAVR